jgi:hypothetical protein
MQRDVQITDVEHDLRDGTSLVLLVEILADTHLPRHNTHPRLEVHRYKHPCNTLVPPL